MLTAFGDQFPASVTIRVPVMAIAVSGDAEYQFQVPAIGICRMVMIYEHARIFQAEFREFPIPPNIILPSPRDLLFPFMQQLQSIQHDGTAVGNADYVGNVDHDP
jgi:hypothetical protein